MPQKETFNDIGTLSLPSEVVLSGKMSTATSNWSSSDLGTRIGADVVSAAAASITVAPIISVIDRFVYGCPPNDPS